MRLSKCLALWKTFHLSGDYELQVLREVRESLRLFPTIPYLARHITEDTTLPSGYTIPDGCGVIIPFIRLHRDPEQYPNPNVFDPDNFLPERVSTRHPYSFCPFSAGPRNCIGQRYAMVQMKALAICLLRSFWFTPVDFKLELASKITMISRTGIRLGLKRRTHERPHVDNIEEKSKYIKCSVSYLDIQFKDNYL
uniref:Cytochrome P450 n=1 Tax=Clastoptera arizonana TaxID=38151 RepID=A0A1B6DUW3_9HEMI